MHQTSGETSPFELSGNTSHLAPATGVHLNLHQRSGENPSYEISENTSHLAPATRVHLNLHHTSGDTSPCELSENTSHLAPATREHFELAPATRVPLTWHQQPGNTSHLAPATRVHLTLDQRPGCISPHGLSGNITHLELVFLRLRTWRVLPVLLQAGELKKDVWHSNEKEDTGQLDCIAAGKESTFRAIKIESQHEGHGKPHLVHRELSKIVIQLIGLVRAMYIYPVYTRFFWQGDHQIYGQTRCIYTVLANPTHLASTRIRALTALPMLRTPCNKSIMVRAVIEQCNRTDSSTRLQGTK